MNFYIVAEVRKYLGIHYVMPIDGSFSLWKVIKNPLYRGMTPYNMSKNRIDGDLCCFSVKMRGNACEHLLEIEERDDIGNFFAEKIMFFNLDYMSEYGVGIDSQVTNAGFINKLKEVFGVEDKNKELNYQGKVDEDYIINLFMNYDCDGNECIIINDEVSNYVHFLIYCYTKDINELMENGPVDISQKLFMEMKQEMLVKMKKEILKYKLKKIKELKKTKLK